MLTASFPPGSTAWLAWIALVPLLWALRGQSPSACFRLGLLTGLCHFLSLIYWIVVVLHSYGGLNPVLSAAALAALAVYLSLYMGAFAWCSHWIRGSRFAIFLTAAAWVALEYVRAHALTGFPWCLLGHSQFQYHRLIQVADLAGVYALSFLVAAINASVFSLLFQGRRRRSPWPFLEAAASSALLISAVFYGGLRLSGEPVRPGPGARVRAAVVQGNIDQSVKWDTEFQAATMETYARLTRQAARARPDLIVWPETAVPFFFQDPSDLEQRVRSLPGETGSHLLFGGPAYSRTGEGVSYYNRAYLLSPRGEVIDRYDKVHLVPFGEYVPLKRFLPFVNRLVASAGDFIPGRDPGPLQGVQWSPGVLICFEAIFREPARIQALQGARMLVNITNDAWFGRTSAPFQHLAMSVFRSVETGLPMVRAANTGISAFVDSRGRITRAGPLFREAVLVGDIDAVGGPRTLYTRFGDVLVLFLFFMLFLRFLSIGRQKFFPQFGG